MSAVSTPAHEDAHSPAILGVALGDVAATQLLTENPAEHSTALQDLLDLSAAGILYLGADRYTAQAGDADYLDPLFSAQALLARFPRAAALVSTSPDVEHPYNYARRVLSVDHFTDGRIGVVVGVRDRRAPRSEGGRTPWAQVPTSPELAADFVTVLRRLWNSWPRESITVDKDQGIFADADQISRINHQGLYSVSGPLNSASSVQGEPPLGWQLSLGAKELPHTGETELIIHDLRGQAHGVPPGDLSSQGSQQIGLVPAADLLEADGGVQVPAFITGALVYIESLAELGRVSAQLERTQAAATGYFSGPGAATLRERLGLNQRSLDTSGYPRAFAS